MYEKIEQPGAAPQTDVDTLDAAAANVRDAAAAVVEDEDEEMAEDKRLTKEDIVMGMYQLFSLSCASLFQKLEIK